MRNYNKMAVKLVTLILFNAMVSESATLHKLPPLHENATLHEIACLCGERPNGKVEFFDIPPGFFCNESKDCQQLSSGEICAIHSCLPIPTDTPDSEVNADKHALGVDSFHQDKVLLPPLLDDHARESGQLRRDRRSSHNCSPPQIEHAEIECYLWAEFISCDIKCSRGYAFEEDGKMLLKTKRVCRKSKPAWSPKNTFPVCKPYINCKAVLVKPGQLTCYPGPDIPYCDISCKSDYENGYGEVAMERFECADVSFAENLPHCATIDNSVDMIKPSENRQMNAPKTG